MQQKADTMTPQKESHCEQHAFCFMISLTALKAIGPYSTKESETTTRETAFLSVFDTIMTSQVILYFFIAMSEAAQKYSSMNIAS